MGRTERAQDSVPGRSGLTGPGRPPGSASLQLTGPSPLPPLCGGSPRVSQIPAGRTHQPHISGRPFLSPLLPRGHTGVPGGAQRHAAPHPQREDLAGLRPASPGQVMPGKSPLLPPRSFCSFPVYVTCGSRGLHELRDDEPLRKQRCPSFTPKGQVHTLWVGVRAEPEPRC